MAAPTLSNYQQSTWSGTSSASEVTGTVTWSAGDVIVVLGMTEDNAAATLNTPTATGLTFAALPGTPTNAASSCKGYAWSATAGSGGSSAVTATAGEVYLGARGIAAFVFSGSDGVGNSSVSTALGSTTVQNLTRSEANSAVVQTWGDWSAVDDTAVTWTPSGQTERVAVFVSTKCSLYVANWGDQGAAGGPTAYGFTGHAGGADMTAITIEVLGTAGGAEEPPLTLRLDEPELGSGEFE